MPRHNIYTPDGSSGFGGTGGTGGGTNDPIDDVVQDVTCWDGSLASSYDKCPDIGDAWDPVEGIGIGAGEGGGLGEGVLGDDWVAPSWWDDPTTTENEYAE